MFTQDRPRFNARGGLGIVLDHRVNITILLLLYTVPCLSYYYLLLLLFICQGVLDRIISVTHIHNNNIVMILLDVCHEKSLDVSIYDWFTRFVIVDNAWQ